ncbi:glycerophosphodiester phosphodiesterase [Leptospira langatensis]|uniref:Glycerophosphodiester phosphodiesterase n=1 Tax=Leptospira langatensis TaxID=2484983 RepID=A0A5F1ZV77_9LEPT|nr:glycerophosphodiester phosphodiesterase family protein [Leptospira langatensis]TGK01377.1 glycerophosphodiester phosphodiesterase [Leptospira langatensis]TGL42172.1 glycerophosphodiester phosphodiesterase [Leptospira langatensis]
MGLDPFSIPKPWVIAHRGDSGEYPENTLLSFRKAVEIKADWIELDITYSADNQIVVIHDDSLDRTTDKKGEIRHLSYNAIRNSDAGSWKHPKFKGEPVPNLWEVWDFLKDKEIGLNVEIKSTAYEEIPIETAIEQELIDYAKKNSLFSKTLFSSFCWDSLARLRELSVDAKLGILIGEESSSWMDALELGFRLNAFSLNLSIHELDPEIVSKIQGEGFKVLVYTLNSEEELKKGISLGVDGIFTNFPARMRSLLT